MIADALAGIMVAALADFADSIEMHEVGGDTLPAFEVRVGWHTYVVHVDEAIG